jgi:hypothetical protein
MNPVTTSATTGAMAPTGTRNMTEYSNGSSSRESLSEAVGAYSLNGTLSTTACPAGSNASCPIDKKPVVSRSSGA